MRVVKADDYQTWFIEEDDYGVLIDPWLDKKLNPSNSVLLQRERNEASSLSQDELDKVKILIYTLRISRFTKRYLINLLFFILLLC